MKKVFLCLLVALVCTLSIIPTPNASRADSSYMRVITENTPFYQNVTDSKPLFYLPYTYYVKALNENNGFIHVECLIGDGFIALDGYVPSGLLFKDEQEVASPYLSLKIKTASSTVLYGDSVLNQPLSYIFADREMQYFGSLDTSHGKIYYVGYNDRLGYVKEDDVIPFTIENHPNALTFIPNDPPVEEPSAPQTPTTEPISEDFFELKIIIIVCLIFAGLIALFIALKQKPKNSAAAFYYDENDFE